MKPCAPGSVGLSDAQPPRPKFDARAPAHRARSITLHTIQRAHRARRELLLVVPLRWRRSSPTSCASELFGVDTPVRVAAAIVLVILGWTLARDLGRWVEPALFRRVDPGTAGTVSFLIRLSFLAIAGLSALRIAGLDPRALAVGGAITAVVFGLAAQQTLGNLIAGVVLIAARPFRIGDRVRLQGGGLAGQIEGTVASLGLLYVTLAQRRGLDHGPQQRRPDLGGRAAARARRGRPARAAAARRQAVGGPGPARERREDAGAPRAAHLARGGRLATRSSSASPPRRSPRPTARASPTRCSPRSPRSPARATRPSASPRGASATATARRRASNGCRRRVTRCRPRQA